MNSPKVLRSVLAFALLSLSSQAIAAPDDLDAAFMATVGTGFSEPTQAVAIQADGKILVGGVQGRFQGSAVDTCFWRLNSDGTLDTAITLFGVASGKTEINDIVIQPDGKILLGGTFDTYDGVGRANIVRLNSDLTIDSTWTATGLSGSTRTVIDIALQPDGKVIIAGGFTVVNGAGRSAIARFEDDGALDATFSPDTVTYTYQSSNYNGTISSVAIQPDGNLIVSGNFSSIGGNPSGNIARLTSTGAYDPTFAVGSGIDFLTNRSLILPDGRILFGGNGGSFQGLRIPSLACFFPNGQLDQTFQTNLGAGPNGWTGGVLQLTPEGQILVGGIFTEWNGTQTASMVRLDLQGNLDPTFTPTPNVGRGSWGGHFYDAAFETDGNIVGVGWISHTDFSENGGPGLQINGTEVYNIARFEGNLLSGPGTIAFTGTATAGPEGGSVTIPITRTGGLSGAVSVTVSTVNGSATSPADFTAYSGSVSWANGEIGPKAITIPLAADALAEGSETFTITLSAATGGASLGANATHTVTIADAQSTPLIVTQPVSRTAVATESTVFTVQALSASSLSYRWQKDNVDLPGKTSSFLALTDLSPSSAGDYHVIVTNAVGDTNSSAATLTITLPPGYPDPSASFGALNSDDFRSIYAFAQLPDGKFLVGGSFNSYGGASAARIIRLNADYTLDATFTIPTIPSNGSVYKIILLPDGKILIGGNFTSVGGHTTRYVARLNANGTVDTSFAVGGNSMVFGTQSLIATLPDGTIYGLNNTALVRLLSSGAFDTSFTSAVTGSQILGLSSGKLLVMRNVGTSSPYSSSLTLVNPDGTIDPSFDNSARFIKTSGGSSLKPISQIREMSDGRILVAGTFTELDSFSSTLNGDKHRVAMLLPDGSLDPSWQISNSGSDALEEIIGLPDGSVVVSGLTTGFSQFDGESRSQLFRISPDGTYDSTFKFPATTNNFLNSLNALLLQQDGRILTARGPVVNDSPSLISLAETSVSAIETAPSATLTVRRQFGSNGPASVTYQTTAGTAIAGTDFTSTSGTLNWVDGDATDKTIIIPLIDNATIQGSRSLTVALSAPTGGSLGKSTATIKIIDDEEPPVITVQPIPRIAYVGGVTEFSVSATSETTLSYQWNKDGAPIPGKTLATLTIDPVSLANAGSYSVTVTNSSPSILSASVPLTVRPDPAALLTTPVPNSTLNTVLALPDGSALIGGAFQNLFNAAGDRLARITAAGTVDTAFSLNVNSTVYTLARQPDGKILLGGTFTTLTGASGLGKIARLNSDGTADTIFNANVAGSGPTSQIDSLSVAPNGKIYVGTASSTYPGANGPFLARLNANGTLDTTFSFYGGGAIRQVLPLQDGQVYVVGSFFNYQGIDGASSLVRLNSSGTLDPSFNRGTTNWNNITQAFVDSQNRLILTASSSIFSGSSIARILPDGSQDPTFGTSTLPITKAAIAHDGTLIATSGTNLFRFTKEGVLMSRPTGFATFTGTPVALDVSPDGSIWLATGSSPYVRHYAGHLSEIVISTQPQPLTIDPGTTASFTVTATTPGNTTSYQWLKNGVPLGDGGNISGSTTASLSITSASDADEAAFSVLVTNTTSGATITSASASLVVLGAPEILAITPSSAAETSEPFTISVTARATGSLSYIWKKDGDVLSGESGPSILIPDPTSANAGTYQVTIFNGTDSIESQEIVISVIIPTAGLNPAFPSLTFNYDIYAVLDLPDGRTLVAGDFTTVTSGTTTALSRLALLDASGALVTTFTLGANSTIFALELDPFGRVLIGGGFSTFGGQNKARIARLTPDLTLDNTFGSSTGPNGSVNSISTLADGTVFLGGGFSSFAGDSNGRYVVKLLPNGSLDTSFVAPYLGNGVAQIQALPDGKVMVGGPSTLSTGGTNSSYFARLSADGSHDTTFTGGASQGVTAFSRLQDGKWLTAGNSGSMRRFTAEGAVDGTWTTTASGVIQTINQDASGRIYIGGDFISVNGSPSPRFAALDSNGNFDASFDVRTGANNTILTQRARALGGRWIAGRFTQYRGKTVSRLALLNGNPIDLAITAQPRESAVEAGQTITFSVAALGTSPLTYQWNKNGTPLTDDARISGSTTPDLTITGATLADENLYTVTVSNPTSGNSLLSVPAEMVLLAGPEITFAPASVTTEAGLTTIINAAARGAGTLSYSWTLSGTPLTDSSTISGASTPKITLLRPLATDSGPLVLTVTNSIDSASITIPLNVTRPPVSPDRLLSVPTFNNTVWAISPGASDIVAVGGQYTSLTTTSGAFHSINGFSMIDLSTGLPDLAYPSLAASGAKVGTIARDPNGDILIGGNFTTIKEGVTTHTTPGRIARIKADKTLDTVFNTNIGTGANNDILKIIVLDDGKLLVSGLFTSFNSAAGTNGIVRLNANGTVDTTFTSLSTGNIGDMLPTAGGKTYIALYSQYGGKSYLARINANGTVDTTFNYNYFKRPTKLIELADGSLLSFGNFPYVEKISSTGIYDNAFPNTNNSVAMATAYQGGILFAGNFVTHGGNPANGLALIDAAGTLDADIAPASGFANTGTIYAMETDASHRIYLGGSFTTFNGQTATRFLVLNGKDPSSVDPFESFTAGLPIGKRGPNDDADDDGLSNLLEFVYRLDPASNSSGFSTQRPAPADMTGAALNTAYPGSTFQAGETYALFKVLEPKDLRGTTLTVQASTDLSDYSGALTAIPLASTSFSADYNEVTYAYSLPISVASLAFHRIRITRN